MSCAANKVLFPKDEHCQRIADALDRRLAPNTGLHPKQLADAIGVTAMTISNWRSGGVDPTSHALTLLCVFFGASFWSDVFGPLGEAMRQRYEERQHAERAQACRDLETLNFLEAANE